MQKKNKKKHMGLCFSFQIIFNKNKTIFCSNHTRFRSSKYTKNAFSAQTLGKLTALSHAPCWI